MIWLITHYLGRSTPAPGLPRSAWTAPLLLLIAHSGAQHLYPSEEDQWRLFNLPLQLLAASVGDVQASAEEWLEGDVVDLPPQMPGLTQLDLDGQELLAAPGRARNVLIITLEGIPGAYIGVNRQALHSSYQENLMPNSVFGQNAG